MSDLGPPLRVREDPGPRHRPSIALRIKMGGDDTVPKLWNEYVSDYTDGTAAIYTPPFRYPTFEQWFEGKYVPSRKGRIEIDNENLVSPIGAAERAVENAGPINGNPSTNELREAIVELAHGLASLTNQFNQLVEQINAINNVR